MLKAAAFALAALLASASVALACSCVRFKTAAEDLGNADVAFVGVVLRTERTPTGGSATTFRVVEALKGEVERSVQVSHPRLTEEACGVSFKRRTRTLVFANNIDGRLSTSACQLPRFDEGAYRAALRSP